MNTLLTKLYRFFRDSLIYLSLVLFLLLNYLCIRYQVFITLIGEAVVVFNNGLLFLLLFFTIIFFIIKYGSKIDFISEKQLFIALVLIYIIIGIYFIVSADTSLRDDAWLVYNDVLSFKSGNFESLLPGNHLSYFPHQLGLITYESLLLLFSVNTRILFFANLVWVILINFIMSKITKLLIPEDSRAVKYTIILSFLFIPQFFFILFAYGTVPGFLCFLTSVYFMLLYLVKKKRYGLLLNILFITFACLLRQNYLIGAIAIMLIYVLNALREKKIQNIAIIAGILFSLTLSQNILGCFYSYQSGFVVGDGVPKILWIAMGLQDDPYSDRTGGWFNDYAKKTYYESGYDAAVASETAINNILDRFDYFAHNIDDAYDFFKNKIISTWCDPLFQSVWSGPLKTRGQETYSPLLANLYNGGMSYKILAAFSNMFVCIIYLFSIVFLRLHTGKKKDTLNEYILIFPLFIIGTFFYHLFSETKSQYVYQAVFALIPLTAQGISLVTKKNIGKDIKTLLANFKKKNSVKNP